MGLVDYNSDMEDPLTTEIQDLWVRTPGEVNSGETMTVGGVTRKVLSMEKAMQRELSFKKKLEVKNQTAPQKPSSIQGANASTQKRDVRGKAPLENISCPLSYYAGRSHLQRSSEKKEQGVTATASTKHTGVQGNTHLAENSCPNYTETSYFQRTPEKKEQEMIRAGAKRKYLPPNQSCPPPEPARQLYLTQTPEKCENTNYNCKECNIIFSNLVNLHNHYQGMKHKAKLEELRIQNGDAPTVAYNIQGSPEVSGAVNVRTGPVVNPHGPEPVRKCQICNCICPGLFNYNQHLNGKRHKARLEELKLEKDGVGRGTEPINCEICKVVCMNEFAYKEHRAGKKHAAVLQAIRSLNSRFPSV